MPIFIPGTRLELYSPVNYEERSVEEIIGIQLSYQYFPVRQSELSMTTSPSATSSQPTPKRNARIRAFYAGADAVIHDAQYTQAEYDEKYVGWGHSTYDWAIKEAHRAKVRNLYFFHHDPLRTDDQLDAVLLEYRKRIAGKTSMEIHGAREGLVIDLPPEPPDRETRLSG